MMRDYLIIAMLTVVAGWRWSLPLIALLCGWSLWRRRFLLGTLCAGLFIWTAVAAWQFEKYL
ncbi:hypothetical protein J0B02_00160 [Enterobacteriaceae bacterium YMB-R22]|uniref:Uncharacterized protein n=3 Tax=Enterobacteriaceae TaxID=543 RepID=A0A8K0V6Z7_9ENTR|nr:hypothetical protein [Tenebrionibacter intestinalis]MBV4411271.1 hypothetical protein [Tenebrionicola larvae]MBV5096910.1 hypothetical protein [Tenebrionicola larvae]